MSPERDGFSIHKRDWSLNRSGPEDERRHNEKVKEAIRGQLPQIISDGAIITADPESKRIIKIPLKSLELPRFKYGKNSQGFGTGPGEEGGVIGQPGQPGGKKGEGAGEGAGVEYYEAELSLEELRQLVYEDLGLPYLQPKTTEDFTEEKLRFDRLLHKPRTTNIDLVRTVLANLKRTAQETGEAKVGEFESEDIWVRTWDIEKEKSTNAIIIAMADISGSMGEFERYVERAFCWWMCDALRQLYPQVKILFVVHDVEAEEVNEEAFFTRGSDGGTKCSSANLLALELITRRYPPQSYNIYVTHFSDGDNYSFDVDDCVMAVQKLLDLGINQYGYVQIGTRYITDMIHQYEGKINHPRFHKKLISSRSDIYPALKEIFSAERL